MDALAAVCKAGAASAKEVVGPDGRTDGGARDPHSIPACMDGELVCRPPIELVEELDQRSRKDGLRPKRTVQHASFRK